MNYTQCHLKRLNSEKTAWIPTKFAVTGKFLRILGENGWEVISTGKTLEGSRVSELERDHLTQRQASDI